MRIGDQLTTILEIKLLYSKTSKFDLACFSRAPFNFNLLRIIRSIGLDFFISFLSMEIKMVRVHFQFFGNCLKKNRFLCFWC